MKLIHPEENPDTVSTLSEVEKDLCRDIRALSDVELLEFLSDLRKMEREQSAERVYQAWQKFDDYQTVECQQCYTKEAFDLAEQAARGEQA